MSAIFSRAQRLIASLRGGVPAGSPAAVPETAAVGNKPAAMEICKRLDVINESIQALVLQARFAALGSEQEFRFLYRDTLVKMHLPFADVDVIQRSILHNHAFYEHQLLQQAAAYISSGAVVLDAGANIGNHTIFFAKVCEAREVLAFEVMRQTFNILERNVQLNGLANVRLFNKGLGARPGRADLVRMQAKNIGNASIHPAETNGAYEIVTVDSLALQDLHFMKIDVEGMHLDVLEGARATLNRCRPVIWIEMRQRLREREPGEKALNGLGYRMVRHMGSGNFFFEPV